MILCVAPACRHRGHHGPGCTDDRCPGCIPRQAAPGLRLCDYHTAHIATDADRAAGLHGELEWVLSAAERPGEHTARTPEHGTALNERATQMRREIRHTLASWCLLVAEERGITTPRDHLNAIGAYLVTHHVWLAAHPAAGDCADELASLHRRAFAVAYPTGARSFQVGPCPAPGCVAVVRVVLRSVDSLLPSELVCEADEPHSWPADRWRELGRLMPTRRYLSAAEIASRWQVSVGSVYRMASQGRWGRTQDGRRPVLYLAADVRASLSAWVA